MTHTPGPWEMSQNIIGGYNIRFDKGKRKAYETVGDIRKKENAQLVIAAPEMYEALNTLKVYIGDGALPPGIREKMKNAIAKAEGREG